MKKFFSRGANLLRKFFLNDHIHDSGCSLKAFRREALANLDLFGEMHRFMPGLLDLDGWRVAEVKVSHHPRIYGKTKYNWRRAFKGFVDMALIWFLRKYVARPVHFFGVIGIFSIAGGIVISLWMLVEKLLLGASLAERMWPLVGVFLLLFGAQFFTFGIVMDFIVKDHYRIHRRMNYVIRETIEQ